MEPNYSINIQSATGVHIGDRHDVTETVSNVSDVLRVSRTKLENYYKRPNAHMRSFIKQNNIAIDSDDLPIKDYYVILTLQKQNNLGDIIEENVSLDAIFSAQCEKHRTILLTGEAGYGKTTLCKKIAYDWASNDEDVVYLSHFYFVVIVDLRFLGENTLFQTVMDTIFDNVPDERRPNLSNANLKVLVILDGFDEFSDVNSIATFLNNDSVNISQESTILITSRPENAELIRRHTDLRFHIKGFSQEQQEEYIGMNCMNSNYYILLNHIRQNDFLNEVAECPLMLNIICSLFPIEFIQTIRRLTDLYVRRMYKMAESYLNELNEAVPLNLINSTYFPGENFLINLVERFPYPLNNRNSITTTSLNEYFRDECERKFIVGVKILHKISEIENIEHYDIVHETFHEFLSALYVTLGHGNLPHLSQCTASFRSELSVNDIRLP